MLGRPVVSALLASLSLGCAASPSAPPATLPPPQWPANLANRAISTLSAFCPSDCERPRVVEDESVYGYGAVYRANDNTIRYSRAFMIQADKRGGDVVVFALTAHEAGHWLAHVFGIEGGTAWEHEDVADTMTGCALAREHMPTGPMADAFRWFSADASSSHPQAERRIRHMNLGAFLCGQH